MATKDKDKQIPLTKLLSSTNKLSKSRHKTCKTLKILVRDYDLKPKYSIDNQEKALDKKTFSKILILLESTEINTIPQLSGIQLEEIFVRDIYFYQSSLNSSLSRYKKSMNSKIERAEFIKEHANGVTRKVLRQQVKSQKLKLKELENDNSRLTEELKINSDAFIKFLLYLTDTNSLEPNLITENKKLKIRGLEQAIGVQDLPKADRSEKISTAKVDNRTKNYIKSIISAVEERRKK